MRKPDFIIVGAMKAGTSSLVRLLREVPGLFVLNETNYFCQKDDISQGFEAYCKLFEQCPEDGLAGEKCPAYSFWPDVPGRIVRRLPDLKLVWILRDPVDRAYSNYWHLVGNGNEIHSFEGAVDLELKNRQSIGIRRYLERSNYATQIERFLEFFPRSQMLFLRSDMLRSDSLGVLRTVCDFLGYSGSDQLGVPDRLDANKTAMPRWPFVLWMARRIFGKKRPFYAIQRLTKRAQPGYPAMDGELRKRLRGHFLPIVERTVDLTGLDLDCWKVKT